jgi:hypothetical protein
MLTLDSQKIQNLDEVGLEVSAEAAVSVPAAHGVPRALQTRVVPGNKFHFLKLYHLTNAQRKLKNEMKIRKSQKYFLLSVKSVYYQDTFLQVQWKTLTKSFERIYNKQKMTLG